MAQQGNDVIGQVSDAATGALLSQHFLREILLTRFAARLGEAACVRSHRAASRWWREALLALGPSSGVRAIRDVGAPLFGLLGYRLRTVGQDDRVPLLHCLLEIRERAGPALVVVPWSYPLDRLWRVAVKAAAGNGRWVVAFNGRTLRVLDIHRPYARRYLEFDLARAFASERAFAILWGLLRAQAFAGDTARERLFDEVVRASEAHGADVRVGLQAGVREALTRLSLALGRGARRRGEEAEHGADEIVSQALTLIYRLLFLLFAEARALVPIWHPVYRQSYSLTVLQRQIEGRGGGAAGSGAIEARGLWDVIRAISRLAHAGCRTDEFSMTAFNGRLFSPSATPLGERGRVSSVVVADVLRALTRTRAGPGRRCERITYGDLGVEELGAIYERVLDHVPVVEAVTAAALSRAWPGPAAGSVQEIAPRQTRRPSSAERVCRKASGTFYTPRSMADYLVRETLAPLVTDASPERVLSLRVLDPAMGSGAFLVCAGRYLAWAYERALERAGRSPPATAEARAEIRRRVARQCLFGVDVNPVAVQLARLSVWLTTLMADAPLTFLDHHLKVGDSLVGATMDDLARRGPAEPSGGVGRRGGGSGGRRTARVGAAQLPLFGPDDVAGTMQGMLRARVAFDAPDDSPAVVRRKERLLERLVKDESASAWRRLADVWCASWFWEAGMGPGPPARAWPAICDFVVRGRAELSRDQLDVWLSQARAIARHRLFFHWVFEFPEVFHDESGRVSGDAGFDAIVGNPPWHVLRANAGRGRGRGAQAGTESATEAKVGGRGAGEMLGAFARDSGVYEPLSDAHPNLYQLFVDRSLGLLKSGGRLGLITPWGLACDHGSARLRRRLFERSSLDTVISFENTGRVFPIHPGLRFLLFTCTGGGETTTVRCRFGERDPGVLDRAEGGEGSVVLTMGVLRRVSGEGLAIPDVRGAREMALLDRLHGRWPALGAREGWGVAFGRELNATDDRGLMEAVSPGEGGGEAGDEREQGDAARPAADMLVIEGKHLRPFRVVERRVTHRIVAAACAGVRERVPGVGRMRLAYRELTFPGRRLALVAAMLPAGVVSTHTAFCLKTMLDERLQWCLCALLNSVVCNYLVRVRAGSHVTAALIQGLPVPKLLSASREAEELARLARRLSLRGRARADDEAESREIVRGRAGRRDYARVQALATWVYGVREEELALLLGMFAVIDEELVGEIVGAYRCVERGG